MAKTKFYAVRNGRKTGIFGSWEECQKQVAGFSGAEFKSFTTRQGALSYLGQEDGIAEKPFADKAKAIGGTVHVGCPAGEGEKQSGTEAVAYVDGSYDKKSGDFSYGVVFMYQGREERFNQRIQDKELAAMHNVAGEIKGSEAAMDYALQRGIKALRIYHDYEGIAKWCTGEWKTNREGTRAYRAYYEGIKSRLQVTFVKVKGHSGDTYNDIADQLAKQALGIGKA